MSNQNQGQTLFTEDKTYRDSRKDTLAESSKSTKELIQDSCEQDKAEHEDLDKIMWEEKREREERQMKFERLPNTPVGVSKEYVEISRRVRQEVSGNEGKKEGESKE